MIIIYSSIILHIIYHFNDNIIIKNFLFIKLFSLTITIFLFLSLILSNTNIKYILF